MISSKKNLERQTVMMKRRGNVFGKRPASAAATDDDDDDDGGDDELYKSCIGLLISRQTPWILDDGLERARLYDEGERNSSSC